jgi:hypothetical protein
MLFDRQRGLLLRWISPEVERVYGFGRVSGRASPTTGRVIVFVAGVFNQRDTFISLAAELSSDYTVSSFDRRGRGKSSDTTLLHIEHEVEDLQAILEVALSSGRCRPRSHHRQRTVITAISPQCQAPQEGRFAARSFPAGQRHSYRQSQD